MKGGAFIEGTLIRAITDPTIALKYYFSQFKIQIVIKWYAELRAFDAKWGFFWSRWRLFRGWTKKRIIKSWKIKGIKKRWKLYSRTFTKSLD